MDQWNFILTLRDRIVEYEEALRIALRPTLVEREANTLLVSKIFASVDKPCHLQLGQHCPCVSKEYISITFWIRVSPVNSQTDFFCPLSRASSYKVDASTP